jgi:hypothetical protein
METSEGLFDKEDLHNRFIIRKGLKPYGARAISNYVLMVKLKKAIKKATAKEMGEANTRVFGATLPLKDFQINYTSLMRVLEIEEDVQIQRCVYILQQEGIVEAIMCLLKKRTCLRDQKFLRNYFLSPSDVSYLSMDDFE